MITVEQYMAAQAVVSARLVALMVRAMLTLGVPFAPAQRTVLAGAALPDVLRARRQSYALSVRYMRYTADRAGVTLPDVAGLPEYRADAVVKVLERVTAPLEPDVVLDPPQVRQVGENLGATLSRHAHQAGRDAVQRTADAAPEAIGWSLMMTGDETCWWCAMHVSRGPVFRSREEALRATGKLASSRRAKVRTSPWHDHCDCVPVLAFKDAEWDGSDQFEQMSNLWKNSTRGKSGKAARKAFAEALASA